MTAAAFVQDRLGREWWQAAVRQQERLAEKANTRCPAAVDRLRALLMAWARGFAAVREDVATAEIHWPSRGIQADEAAGFLAALDARLLHVDSAGYIYPLAFQQKARGGRYCLFSRSGNGVLINLEYVIQLAAACELIRDHGIPGESIHFEAGTLDALAHPSDGEVLAMEVKCRVDGSDGLLNLLAAFL